MSFSKLKTIVTLSAVILILGYHKTGTTSQFQEGSRTKIRAGYFGFTCEAPIFSAGENGFFKEEGLVELVKCAWSKYKDVPAFAGFDTTHHLIRYLL
jgi:ABC-type nitrate/sulfonate/bicarbonate transport system substrate-binding protein